MRVFFLFFLAWLVSLIVTSIYVYENPDRIEILKNYFQGDKNVILGFEVGEILRTPGNSFMVEFSKKISFSEKTAFIIHDENILNFDENVIKIYFQNGYLLKNSKLEKINLPNTFTTLRNGGIKAIFVYKGKDFGLISSSENGCFYASIILLKSGQELFKTKCLPNEKIDFNGLGSSHIHQKDKIFLSIGAPEKASAKIRELAQDRNSMFGKILEIDKNNLDKIIKGEDTDLDVKIFTLGHRNPQGFTKINDSFFSVEHGPKGGDELNKIIKDKNYGWPRVSYGTQYIIDEKGKAYEINHENNQFEEPLFALVPSVGISALNTCPTKLKNFYKNPAYLPCLYLEIVLDEADQ